VSHVSVCICTYRRPQSLAQLLTALTGQVDDDADILTA
jgi:glycosyltransferase involved in cell wall biosynthesis